MSIQKIRERWAAIGQRRAEAADGIIWNDDAVVDEIIEHAEEDVDALLAILDEIDRDDLVSALIRTGHYEPGD